MDYSSSDSSTDEECIFGNNLLNINLVSTSAQTTGQPIVPTPIVEAEETENESGDEGKENEPGDEGKENKPGHEGKENEPGHEGKENEPGNEGKEIVEGESSETEIWLYAKRPSPVLTENQVREQRLRQQRREERERIDFEGRFNDEKIFTRTDEKTMINYLIKYNKIPRAHTIDAWYFLSSIPSLEPRRSASCLRDHFVGKLRRNYHLFTNNYQAVSQFLQLNRQLGLECKACGRY